jgi:hypothetical protein
MQRKENGWLITDDDVKSAGKILGYIAAGALALRLIRIILWPYPTGKGNL